jgi:nondiscriminating glutamyl-tRNA synthetase
MSVRVRFAPSPTGPLHLGNARIAVINRLFAQKEGGRLILRLEDTDEARFDPGAEALIDRDLEWLGILPDEGPRIGGAFGPYRQSERHEIYTQTADRLLASGLAYRCFCSDETLADERKRAVTAGKPPRYSGRCRSLTDGEIASRAGEPFTVRFRADFTEIRIHDLIHREIAFGSDAFGDFVIMRTDGSAVFIFSSAVDDCLMGITHVIRGEDHLPNTPRQVLIHRALGNAPPVFAHVPLLVTESGDKIKKREGGFDIETLIERGYVPEGIFAYLAAVGNPAVTGKRILSRDQIAQSFDITRLGRSAVKIEPEKIARMNTLAVRQIPADDLASRLAPFLRSHGYDTDRIGRPSLALFADAVRDNISTLADATAFAPIFFSEIPPIDDASRHILAQDESRRVLTALLTGIDGVTELTDEAYHSAIRATADETGIDGRPLFAPIRAALTGMEHGPALEKIAEAVGLHVVKGRIRNALRLP